MNAVCRCGRPAARLVFAQPFCGECWDDRLKTFALSTLEDYGVGLVDGRWRPEHGRHHAELRCSACREARWVGVPGEACWCQLDRAVEVIHDDAA